MTKVNSYYKMVHLQRHVCSCRFIHSLRPTFILFNIIEEYIDPHKEEIKRTKKTNRKYSKIRQTDLRVNVGRLRHVRKR